MSNAPSQNDHLVLISGLSATGKSASLRDIDDPPGVLYLNAEGKRLPFKSQFQEFMITDPLDIVAAFEQAKAGELDNVHTIIVDTMTFMMDMYETQYVLTSTNTMQGWSNYGQFFKTLLQKHVASCNKNVIFLGHTREELDEATGTLGAKVPIKGALQNNGVEAYFSTVISTKKIPTKILADYDNPMLKITDEEKALGFKYVFQTKLTKETVAESIRAPLDMWNTAQTYIDNNAQLVLNRLHDYYND